MEPDHGSVWSYRALREPQKPTIPATKITPRGDAHNAGRIVCTPLPGGARPGAERAPARWECKGSERRKVFAQRNPEGGQALPGRAFGAYLAWTTAGATLSPLRALSESPTLLGSGARLPRTVIDFRGIRKRLPDRIVAEVAPPRMVWRAQAGRLLRLPPLGTGGSGTASGPKGRSASRPAGPRRLTAASGAR